MEELTDFASKNLKNDSYLCNLSLTCCGCSGGLSQCDGSFDHLKHVLKLAEGGILPIF